MAQLLYRIGRFAARRRWTVIGGWGTALAVGAIAFLLFAGSISSAITIPNTPTSRVTMQLTEDFEGASAGSGTVVFETDDGAAFTKDQQKQISGLVTGVGELDEVQSVTDPFAVQGQLDSTQAQLDDGQAQITGGRQRLKRAEDQLDQGRRQVAQQRDQARASGTLDAVRDQLAAGQASLDQAQQRLDQQRAKLATQAQTLASGQQVAKLSSGARFVSQDGSAAIATVSFSSPVNEVPAAAKTAIDDELTGAGIDGVEVYPSQDISQSVPAILGPGEIAGVGIAALVLVLMLGTVVGAALPLASAVVGVGVATLAAMSFSGIVEFQSVTPVLGVMLGLAVGIDYSLFILNRHRTQLKRGMDLEESIGLANGTSGNAVVFAGATVMVALLALNVTGIPFLGLMGTVGAAAVFVAILVATTFTPAMLSLTGMRVLKAKERDLLSSSSATPTPTPQDADAGPHREVGADSDAPATRSSAGATGVAEKGMRTGRAVLTLVLGIAALVVIALPALDMRLGLPDGASQPEDSAAYQAYSVQAEKFGEGSNAPLVVVADLPSAIDEADLTTEQATLGQAIYEEGDVAAVVPIGASRDGAALAFQVVPDAGPSSQSTADLVDRLRDAQPQTASGGTATLGVAGNASANIDVSQQLSDALPVYLLVVVGLSLLILILVFRSVLVPLTATLGFVLSLVAAFGGLTAVFQFGWLGGLFGVHDPAPILSFLPIIETGILFGLAMDYQLFLVSGMREAYSRGASAKVAVRRGLHAGRAVVTAAAIIMTSVFAGFVFSHDTTIKPIGFGLAFGVLLDAFVVRLLVIPAAMHLIGDKAWWLPRWLDRILPDVDVEGAGLERSHPGASPASADRPDPAAPAMAGT